MPLHRAPQPGTRYELRSDEEAPVTGIRWLMGKRLADEIGPFLPDVWQKLLTHINVLEHFEDFAKGVFDTSSLVYFVSGTAFFLFLAAKTLESRRWR